MELILMAGVALSPLQQEDSKTEAAERTPVATAGPAGANLDRAATKRAEAETPLLLVVQIPEWVAQPPAVKILEAAPRVEGATVQVEAMDPLVARPVREDRRQAVKAISPLRIPATDRPRDMMRWSPKRVALGLSPTGAARKSGRGKA